MSDGVQRSYFLKRTSVLHRSTPEAAQNFKGRRQPDSVECAVCGQRSAASTWPLLNLKSPDRPFIFTRDTVECKVHPITCREDPEGEKKYSFTRSLTSAVDGGLLKSCSSIALCYIFRQIKIFIGHLYYLLTYSVEQSPSSEANWFSS